MCTRDSNGTAFGDVVNVAARLQSLAKPGGVQISGSVYDHVRRKLQARFVDAGTRQIRNIPEPVRTFEVLPANTPGLGGKVWEFLACVASRRARCAAARVVIVAGAVAFGLLWRGLSVSESKACANPIQYSEPASAFESSAGSHVAELEKFPNYARFDETI